MQEILKKTYNPGKIDSKYLKNNFVSFIYNLKVPSFEANYFEKNSSPRFFKDLNHCGERLEDFQ